MWILELKGVKLQNLIPHMCEQKKKDSSRGSIWQHRSMMWSEESMMCDRLRTNFIRVSGNI